MSAASLKGYCLSSRVTLTKASGNQPDFLSRRTVGRLPWGQLQPATAVAGDLEILGQARLWPPGYSPSPCLV